MERGTVLFYAPSPVGGIAVHVHYQARELARRGFAVDVLCRPDFFQPAVAAVPGHDTYRQTRRLIAVTGAGLLPKLGRVLAEIANRLILAWFILRRSPRFVVWEANSEYFSPAWFAPLWLLRKMRGVVTLANFHDPLRERRWGPRWFHDLTMRLAYAPLDGGLIHGAVPPGARLPARLAMREAPFGPFDDLLGLPPAFDLRARLGIASDAFVLLAFGHIADRKNLDLAIAALGDVPGVHLVIAGSPAASRDKPATYYQANAERLGLADRVHILAGFIPEPEIATYFAAADAVLLTYERGFVSQSGVLQIAALWDRPLLASGGEGPLVATVLRYGLGLVVEPDSIPAIAEGLARLVAERPVLDANFSRYRESTSWSVNIDRLLEVHEAVRAARWAASNPP